MKMQKSITIESKLVEWYNKKPYNVSEICEVALIKFKNEKEGKNETKIEIPKYIPDAEGTLVENNFMNRCRIALNLKRKIAKEAPPAPPEEKEAKANI